MEKYPLWLDNKEVGSVTVKTKGLYYHFLCACNIATDMDSRVRVHCGEKTMDLGICVPEQGSYTLRKQIPIKHIGRDKLKFEIRKRKQFPEKHVALYANRHFEKITSLENAKLFLRDGIHYIYWD